MFKKQSVSAYSKKVRAREASAEKTVTQLIDGQREPNKKLNAILEINERALQRAKEVDEGRFDKGRLTGVPILVKDNFCVAGQSATAASRILENFKPPYTAHCIQRLEDEGAIIIGKTNMDEFAMGSSNENSFFGPCRNPWNLDYVPGGSSGGSAAAVAAGLAPISVGSDTGGSIRQPASFCGVVGIKPTYGAVSRYGMIAFASSLDQAGTFGRSVADAALALEVMIDHDTRDATNVRTPFATLSTNKSLPLKGVRVGVVKEYMAADLNKELREAIEGNIETLKQQGCEIVDVSLPHTDYAIPVYYLVAASEASSNLSRYDGVRYGLRDLSSPTDEPLQDLNDFYKRTRSHGFGDEVKRRILLGTFSLSAGYFDAFYAKACQVRRLISDDFKNAYEKCDFIVGPVSTAPAFKMGEKKDDPISMYYNDILTTPASLAGLPSMSLPLGLSSERLPLGLQVIAPPFHDDKMVMFANALEELIGFTEVCNV